MYVKIIKPKWGSKFFGLAKFDEIIFDQNKISIIYKNDIVTIPIETIKNYKIIKSFLYNSLIINLKNNSQHRIDGFPNNAIKSFTKEFDEYFAQIYYTYYYDQAYEIYRDFPTQDTYWRKQSFKEVCIQALEKFEDYKELQVAPSLEQKIKLDLIAKFLSQDETFRQKHNRTFIEHEKREYKDFFDHVENNPLTNMQQEAVVTYEKNSLIIAGAGSGKTSVMVAKAGYLTKKYAIDPNNILLLAFNKKASIELKERIKEKLNLEIDALTFHALGLSIIAEVEEVKPSLGPWAEDEKKMKKLLQDIVDRLLVDDKEFADDLMEYFQRLFFQYESEFDFETQGEYIDYIKSIELRSFNDEKVKSYEECEIANFLFMNQITYQYEPSYEYSTESKEFRQYRPDFYLPEYGIYIEHFGVNGDGSTAPYVNKTQYHEGMVWKRALHRHYGTKLIETYSCEKKKGILTSNLKDKLEMEGVKFNPMSMADALHLLNESGMTNAFIRLCATFLSNYKSNNHTIEALEVKAYNSKDSERSLAFLKLFSKIIDAYENHQKSNNMIDFNDMINKAVSYIANRQYKSKYTHILVDEFQDISTTRAEMVKELMVQQSNGSLCVVGDDWQSINRFAGSDISIVRNFESIYGDSEIIHLDYTFRYNDEISKVSQEFIERNPHQIKKKIKTIRKSKGKALFVWWDNSNIIESIKSIFDVIAQKRANEEVSVFILARFWHLIPNEIKKLNTQYLNITIQLLSVHASKGLEADYVIILGNEAGKFGFPSAIEDDPIIDLVLAESEEFPFAEERRLFYVAMTRAKDEVHFFTSKMDNSLFIEELMRENIASIEEIGENTSEELEPCIKCKTGKLVIRKIKNSDKSFLGCTNYPYCDYIKPLTYCTKCKQGTMVRNDLKKIYECSNEYCNNTLPLCTNCGAVMVKRKGRYGEFFGCTNYPICKNILKYNYKMSPSYIDKNLKEN